MSSSSDIVQPVAGPALRRRALIAMLSVTVIWGWTFVWMKQSGLAGDAWLRTHAPQSAAGGASPYAGLFVHVGAFMLLRFSLAAILLAMLSRRARAGLDGQAWRGGLMLGGLLFLGFFLQMFGLASVSASVSAFLTSLYVVCTAAITAALARRAPPPRLMAGALLATLGAAWIGGPPQIAFGAGEWLTIASALVFAVHIVATDRVTKRVDPLAVTLTSFLVIAAGSLCATAVGFASRDTPQISDLAALFGDGEFTVPLLCSSFFATLIAISLMNVFQRELDPVRAAIVYAIEPVFAALISISLGMEQPNRWLFLGGGALLAGNLVAELRRAPA
ncbi:MAG TPA: DMT family transporter [Planctomycetota bacterium]|nr:DMT family transporter [Planctomycetota bacterium]